MCVLLNDWQNTTVFLGIATWTRAAALNLRLSQVWPFCGLLYSWHVKDIMRKKMKLKGKIYKHMLTALRLNVPEDFNLKWISVSQNPHCLMLMMSFIGIPVEIVKWLCKSDDSNEHVLNRGSCKMWSISKWTLLVDREVWRGHFRHILKY